MSATERGGIGTSGVHPPYTRAVPRNPPASL